MYLIHIAHDGGILLTMSLNIGLDTFRRIFILLKKY